MQLKNMDDQFGLVAITFHWVMAIIIICLICLGLYMSDLPISMEKLKLYGWHKEFGLLVLMLVVLRLSWRWLNILPELNLPRWEIIAARTVSWAFYFLMFAMPLTGWLMTSYAGLPVSFFGLFVMPDLVLPDHDMIKTFKTLHKYLAYSLIAIITLHILAALKHHFIDKDNILRRMV